MRDQIDEIDALRRLLDLPDRDSVSFVQLEQTREAVPDDPTGLKRWIRTGDVAFVFVGPKDQLQAVQRENTEDGTLTVEFTFPGAVEKAS